MQRKCKRVALVSFMAVTSIALASSKSYAQTDPITLGEIAADTWWAIDKLQKGYNAYTILKGIFDPDATTAALIAAAVSDLENFYVDETVKGYVDEANAIVLPEYVAAINASPQSAVLWQQFDHDAYFLVTSLYNEMWPQGVKTDRYSHALGSLYNTILPLYLAVHLNGARWGISPRSTAFATLLDDAVDTAKTAIELDYNLVGSSLRWTYGSNPQALPDDTGASVLYQYIKANYDNGSSDNLCAAFFQTDATVQAAQIGGLGIYNTFAYSAQNPGGSQNLDLVQDIVTGVTVRLDADDSWGHHWAGYGNAVWTPMYHNNNGVWVIGRSCPANYGVVAMWNVPKDPWHVGFLCQKWPAAPPLNNNSGMVYLPQSGTYESGGMLVLSYGCPNPFFMVGASDTGDNFLCRQRDDIRTPIPSQALPVQEIDLLNMSESPTGIINSLPAGTYLIGADYSGYSHNNTISYYSTGAQFPSGSTLADAWNQGTITTPTGTTQRYPIDFNIFALQGATGFQDVRGPVAAGGDVTLASFAVNGDSGKPVALVVGGNLTLSVGGTVQGLTYYGGTKNIAQSVTLDGAVMNQNPIDFPTAFTKLEGMSTALSLYPANGTVTTDSSTITLSSSDPNFTVFSLSADALSKASSIDYIFPVGSTVVINVSGVSVSMQNIGFSAFAPVPFGRPTPATFNSSHVIWNFYQATSLFASSITIYGSVLAPLANAQLQWGAVDGTLVASTVNAFNEFHWNPFQSNLLVGP
jgi:choice-of-anchor A domain-containing protein